jgi:4-amino-4-deoxy-L-arabinose transferase-like glycosyltransferase
LYNDYYNMSRRLPRFPAVFTGNHEPATITARIREYRYGILLAAILVLSGILNFWNVWNQGYSNLYYAAAVRSMLVNPGIAFFNSFDPAGFVTIDKPPVGLWVQAAFAAVLGFSGWSLVLPQALCGVGSVALLYCIVSRPFGEPAGLVSAFALAVTPIFVAVSRNGTMDAQLIFVILLAVWAALKSVRGTSRFPGFSFRCSGRHRPSISS